jgi:hypothetical protein
MNTVIGATFHDAQLTVVLRSGHTFASITQRENLTDGEALNSLLSIATDLRHENPIVYMTGDDGPRLAQRMSALEFRPFCQSFDWLSASNGASFANAGTEMFTRLIGDIRAGRLTLSRDGALLDELEAFKPDRVGDKHKYAHPDDVGEALGRYPARALATLMAYLPERQTAVVQQNSQHPSGGHTPF